MAWWAWVLAGFGFLLLELFTSSGFYLFFFGVSALILGLFVFLGMGGPIWFQWTVCAVLALILLLWLRKPLMGKFSTGSAVPPDVDGEAVKVIEDILPGEMGQGEMRGTSWKVSNEGAEVLKSGQRYNVSRTDGIKLIIK